MTVAFSLSHTGLEGVAVEVGMLVEATISIRVPFERHPSRRSSGELHVRCAIPFGNIAAEMMPARPIGRQCTLFFALAMVIVPPGSCELFFTDSPQLMEQLCGKSSFRSFRHLSLFSYPDRRRSGYPDRGMRTGYDNHHLRNTAAFAILQSRPTDPEQVSPGTMNASPCH